MCEPHWLQKYLTLPGDASNPLRRSSPLTQRSRSRGTLGTVENAEPWVLRQVWQWQCTIVPGSASTSYATFPHRQLPVSMMPSRSNKNPAQDIILWRDYRTPESRVVYFRLSMST